MRVWRCGSSRVGLSGVGNGWRSVDAWRLYLVAVVRRGDPGICARLERNEGALQIEHPRGRAYRLTRDQELLGPERASVAYTCQV